jgi:clumping factor A
MIVVSLLLILVAVALLVLGLTGGSSTLLISSIVASLLAAVVLVVGARQAAARRRTAAPGPDGVPADPEHDPFLAGAPAEFVDERRGRSRRRDEPAPAMATSAPADGHTDAANASGPATDRGPATDPGPATDDAGFARQGSAPAPDDAHADFSGSGPILGDEPDRDARRSADAADDPSSPPGFREDAAAPPGHDPDDREHGRRQEPDYDHASSVIGAARTAGDDQSWRRDPDAGPPPAAPDEFAEPDEDDPADEPLPQAVRPGDAVRMARIDSEVLVVDGRPRYHLADCPHLVGRLTEALPAREAVELGFSPCGLCRPVDRLVAAESAHH